MRSLLRKSVMLAGALLVFAGTNASGTFLMVSHDQSGYQDGAVELSGAGAVPDVGFVATSAATTTGNFYPKIAARTGQKEWLMSTATSFAATTVQRLQTTASGGSGGGWRLADEHPRRAGRDHC